MKKLIILSAFAAVLFCACSSKPTECYIPKNTVEFAGNSFTSFSLGADVKLYSVQNPSNSSEWTLQAVVPIRKEISAGINDLSINLVPLDDHGVRVRDGLVLEAEDLPNLIPVYNSGQNVERTIVFSISDEDRKYMSSGDVAQLIENTKGVRIDFNQSAAIVQQPVPVQPQAAPAAPAAPQQYPMTLDGLLRRYGIYGMLSQYDRALRNDNGKAAKRIEDQMYVIEQRVSRDGSIPKWLRDRFVEYIEDKEDEIEDRY